MIDIHQLLAGLTQAIEHADFPDSTSLATALDLDISDSSIMKTKLSSMCINRAHLNRSGTEVGIACTTTPRREIWLIFLNPLIPYRDVKDEIFGTNQHIKQSKLSTGFGVLFEIDGLTCGFTASSPDGDVDSLFCEEPKPASAG
ncbi:MAG: hypothetical protein ACLQIQ_08650 [Beijerinckiaceae bacterium]